MSDVNTFENISIRLSDETVILIDGANFWSTCKNLGFDIDYKALLKLLQGHFNLVYVAYYTATVTDSDNVTKIRPILDWLSYNGYRVVEKPAKVIRNRESGEVTKIKGNMDVEIAIDAIEAANYVKNIVLFTGDGDFTALLRALQRKGVRVIVVSSTKTPVVMIADELRRQADFFVELETIRDAIERVYNTNRADNDNTGEI